MAKCPHCKKPVILNGKTATSDARAVRKEVVGKVKKELFPVVGPGALARTGLL